MKHQLDDGGDLRGTIREFWLSAGAVVLAFAVTVVAIYASEAHEWKKNRKKLELAQMQKQLELQSKAALVGCYVWENSWEISGINELGPNQYRKITKLSPGVEVETGLMRKYDVNMLRGFDQVIPDPEDDSYYIDPIFTFTSEKFLRIRSSIDGGDGWLLGGTTLRGIKSGNLQFIPENPKAEPSREYLGSSPISVQVPVNGQHGLDYNLISPEISEEMRLYNYTYVEKLGDIYSGVPELYADRERVVHVSHLIIEVWSADPRVDGPDKPSKPEATLKIRLRRYGDWDLTTDEYASMGFSVPLFTVRNFREFSPRTTVELIV